MTGYLPKVTHLVRGRARTRSQLCPHSLANPNPSSPSVDSGSQPLGKQKQSPVAENTKVGKMTTNVPTKARQLEPGREGRAHCSSPLSKAPRPLLCQPRQENQGQEITAPP